MTTKNNLKTFRNKNFVKRDYECTNVIACQAEKAPNENFVECGEWILKGLTQLWIQNDVRYFGHV